MADEFPDSGFAEKMSAALGEVTFVQSITQLVDSFGGPGRGGGTKQAAAYLGVSMRQVQAALQYERGVRPPPGGARGPGARARRPEPLIRRIPPPDVVEAIRRGGMRILFFDGTICISEDCRRRKLPTPGARPILLEPQHLTQFLAALEAGDQMGAARVLAIEFLDAWGGQGFRLTFLPEDVGEMITHVDQLDLRPAVPADWEELERYDARAKGRGPR